MEQLGGAKLLPPFRNASLSYFSWNLTPASTSSEPKSEVLTSQSMPLLAVPLSRFLLLMPLTQSSPSLVEQTTTSPPGHMQNEYTPRPFEAL